MSATHETAPPAPLFRLETLGTLVLREPEGRASVAADAQQSRRLALLAVLAASGGRGCSRDRLLLLFWPDSSQQRARHSLEQLLYLIRRSVDASVIPGVNPLRLNPAVMTSDVAEFEDALSEGDLEAAVGLYHGPFLEGFYLSDSPEFEQWMEGERARLEMEYMKALERLAQSAESAEDYRAAVGWWRKLADADPVSSRNAIGLMCALAKAGDHAAALRHAERYEGLVEQELGTGAGPEIVALAEEIRASAKVEKPALRQAALRAPTADREHTREPVRSEDYDEMRPVTGAPRASRRPGRVILYGAAALLLAAVVFAWMRMRDEPIDAPAAATVEPSIAVLPLSNLSTDPRDAVLADGMTEELIAMLAKTGDLRVIASTSAFAFRNRQADVRSIADSLGVSNVLEGGVQKIGSRLRVQVRLVDARDGSTRWSETYDREIEDLFEVQGDIARMVARELGVRLGGSAATQLSRHRTQSVAAYELYLRGSDPALLRSDSTVRDGVEFFRQAIAIDSTYAAAYAGLARMYLRLAGTDYAGMPARDLHSLAEEAALKAVALDDSLPEARATLGGVRMNIDHDFATAEIELKRAIDLDPAYGRAREILVRLYLWTERPEEALAEARRALEIDPLSPSAHAEVAHALVANGRYDEALAQLEHIAEVQPPLLRSAGIAAQAYAGKQMWPEAIAALGCQVEKGSSQPLSLCAYMLARAGQRDEALRIQATLLDRWRRGDGRAFDIAVAYAGLGDFDQAFVWLDRSIEEQSLLGTSYFTIMEPIFDDLRSDPRFERVKERLGLQNR